MVSHSAVNEIKESLTQHIDEIFNLGYEQGKKDGAKGKVKKSDSYDMGVADCWEFAKKLHRMGIYEANQIFGKSATRVFDTLTAPEAMKIDKDYTDTLLNSVGVGDVVKVKLDPDDEIGIVTAITDIYDDSGEGVPVKHCAVLFGSGKVGNFIASALVKQDRSFPLFMQAIKNDIARMSDGEPRCSSKAAKEDISE